MGEAKGKQENNKRKQRGVRREKVMKSSEGNRVGGKSVEVFRVSEGDGECKGVKVGRNNLRG